MLERREQVDEVERLGLGPGPLDADEIGGLAPLRRHLGAPLPVPPVEDEHRAAVPQAEHVQEIVRLPPLQRKPGLGSEIVGAKEPRRGEIVGGHAAL